MTTPEKIQDTIFAYVVENGCSRSPTLAEVIERYNALNMRTPRNPEKTR